MKPYLAFTLLVSVGVASCTTTKVAEATKPTITSKPLPATIAAGSAIYSAKCGRCHRLYPAAAFTAAKWEKNVEDMAPRARLTDEERKAVLAFVQDGAK